MLDTDPLETAFAAFADEAPRDIVAPGSAAAHRRVGRRRVGSGIAAAIIVITVAASGAGEFDFLAPDRHATHAASITNGPSDRSLSGLGLRALSEIAGLTPSSAANQSTLMWGSYGAVTSGGFWSVRIPGRAIAPGRYEIDTTCYGTGSIQLEWTTDAGRAPIPTSCSTGSTVTVTDVTVGADGHLDVRVDPHSTAVEPTGFAYVVTTPTLDETSLSTLAAEAQTVVTGAAGTHTGSSSGTGAPRSPERDSDRTATQGARTMEYVCLGRGATTVRWAAGGNSVNALIPCDGAPRRLNVDGNAPGTAIEVTPDLDASGRSAYAYVQWRS